MVSEWNSLTLQKLNLGSNMWGQWRQHFELFSLASGLSLKDTKIQSAPLTANLLHVIGSAALEVYNTFMWANDDDKQRLRLF